MYPPALAAAPQRPAGPMLPHPSVAALWPEQITRVRFSAASRQPYSVGYARPRHDAWRAVQARGPRGQGGKGQRTTNGQGSAT